MDVLSDGANIQNPVNRLVTDTKVKEYLTNNYYNNTEVDKKIANVTVKTESDIKSTSLEVRNGEKRIIGTKDIYIELKNGSVTKEKLSSEITKEIDNKANKNGDNIVSQKDKEDFRNAIEVYSKAEVDHKVNGKNEITIAHEKAIEANREAILRNSERINELEGRVKETVALSSALASIEYPKVGVGEVGVGAGIAGYQGKQGVAIGATYMPVEDLLLSLKYSGLTNNRYRGVVSASVGYKFRLH